MPAPKWEEGSFEDGEYDSLGGVVDALIEDLPGEPGHANMAEELLNSVETVEWLASDDHYDAVRLHFESGLVADATIENVGDEATALAAVKGRVQDDAHPDEEREPTEKVRVVTGGPHQTVGFENDMNEAIAEEATEGYRLADIETHTEPSPRDDGQHFQQAVLTFTRAAGGEADE
jgi:hypothetical protein